MRHLFSRVPKICPGASAGPPSLYLGMTNQSVLTKFYLKIQKIRLFSGYKVSDTMRKGILDISVYKDSEIELMLGCVSALTSSAIWLLTATFLKLPISGTHSIVGASIGFSLVARGTAGLHWKMLGTIGKINRIT